MMSKAVRLGLAFALPCVLLFVTASTARTTVAAVGNVRADCVKTCTLVTPESTGTCENAGQA